MPPVDFAHLLPRTACPPVHLRPYADIHHAFIDDCPASLAEWLNGYFLANNITPRLHTTATPLSFVSQDDLPHGTAYEAFIHKYAKIPTRDNLHDWFGACVWAKFPKTKALLNAKHIAHFDAVDSGNGRNRVRDTITVFDENGAIIAVSDDEIGSEIADALVGFDWQTCLVKNRHYWHNPDIAKRHTGARAFIFGHALLEQMLNPYKSLCAHALIVRVPQVFFAKPLAMQLSMLDELLCDCLDKFLVAGVTPRQLNPLPILGVPYFWDNADAAFYQDEFVFRKGRRHQR